MRPMSTWQYTSIFKHPCYPVCVVHLVTSCGKGRAPLTWVARLVPVLHKVAAQVKCQWSLMQSPRMDQNGGTQSP